MNRLIPLCTLALLAAAATAQAASPLNAPKASRIVGAWANTSYVGPCGGAPGAGQQQTIVFNAGGTFLDNARFPPGGIPNLSGIPGTHQRSIGVGTWDYNRLTDQFTLDQRFDWFVNGAYHGYQVVLRTIQVSGDGSMLSGPVHTVRYTAAGQVVGELCGHAESTRL